MEIYSMTFAAKVSYTNAKHQFVTEEVLVTLRQDEDGNFKLDKIEDLK